MNRRAIFGTIVALLALFAVAYAPAGGALSTDRASSPTESTRGLDPDVVKQIPMSNAADKIYQLWQSAGYQDFTGLSFDNETWTVVLYWKGGNLPTQMDALVTELRETVPIRVVNAAYSLEEFQAESMRLLQLGTVGGVDINEAGPNGDFSALRVGVDISGDQTKEQKIVKARQAITSAYPLEFKITPELVNFRSR